MVKITVPFTIGHWMKSMMMLGLELHAVNFQNNLMSDAAIAHGQHFFADDGIPRPRPITFLAWASLCSMEPIGGWVGDYGKGYYPFRASEGRFILPFLPKLLSMDNVQSSLIRNSKAHIRDAHDRIRWGSIYIAEAADGDIIDTIHDGQLNPKTWVDVNRGRQPYGESVGIPPMWAEEGSGWDFGAIQWSLPGMNISFRTPYENLAEHGMIQLSRITPQSYRNQFYNVRRLMFRFINEGSLQEWARRYSVCANMFDEGIDRKLNWESTLALDEGHFRQEILAEARRQSMEVFESKAKSNKQSAKQIMRAAIENQAGLSLETLMSGFESKEEP
jgi:hypothetical protein